MTVEELKVLNLPIEANAETALYCGAAIDWIEENTILPIDDIAALPDGAKLFICKYHEVMSVGGNGVASESIGGMSQSFTTDNKAGLLWQLASELIGSKYLKGQVHSVPNVSKWV